MDKRIPERSPTGIINYMKERHPYNDQIRSRARSWQTPGPILRWMLHCKIASSIKIAKRMLSLLIIVLVASTAHLLWKHYGSLDTDHITDRNGKVWTVENYIEHIELEAANRDAE